MKLNLSKKTQNSIQSKVNSILALNETDNNDNTGKELGKMKLNFSKKTESIETAKNTKLQLNKTESKMETNNLTIDKFDRVEKLSKSIDSIESTFIDFLKSQNESITMVNSFNKKLDNLEILILNSIKNQKSILDGINSFHAKAFQPENKTDTIETEKPVETKLRKGQENKTDDIEIDSDNPEMIYNAFMELFKGNFKGTKELTEINSFIPFISAIDFDSIASITKSYEKYFSAYLKENNNKQLIARKSKSNAINSLIELGKVLGLEINTTLDDTDINSTPIDKAYFVKLFNLDMSCINDLISESVEYGKVDDTLIDTIGNFIKSDMPDISDNQLGQFIKYIKTYIDKA